MHAVERAELTRHMSGTCDNTSDSRPIVESRLPKQRPKTLALDDSQTWTVLEERDVLEATIAEMSA